MQVKKWDELRAKMHRLGILETDLQEKFILGSGSGGQNLHKTASTVYLKHIPTGLEIKCQESRSRDDNRLYARRRLCEKFEEQVLHEKSERRKASEKIRRQKRRRSRKAKLKMLDDKKQRSKIKTLRKPPKEQ
ncbi:MAG TPA: peptide chain release factor-like protein [Gammaproteobacteria bacterium]|nr:peptide chain release factor-like protein [Gammaproteobacteria bacterium]